MVRWDDRAVGCGGEMNAAGTHARGLPALMMDERDGPQHVSMRLWRAATLYGFSVGVAPVAVR